MPTGGMKGGQIVEHVGMGADRKVGPPQERAA
jgi:hypothetical protein